MMNWLKQVWHVAKKDVRQFRWLLSVQVLATVMAVMAVVGPSSHMGGPGFPRAFPTSLDWYMVLIGLAILISAVVVQADSPSRSDAFWASRPLHPLAVLVAKGATLGVFLLAIPLVAEAMLLSKHAVPSAEMVSMLAQSLVTQAGIVVGAATLAALTANLSAFFMVGIGAGVAAAAVSSFMDNLLGGAFETLAPVEMAAPVLGLGLVVLAHQYSSRNLRRSVIGATLGGVMGLAIVGWTSGGYAEVSERPVTAPPDVVRTDLRWGAFEVEPVIRSNEAQPTSWTLSTTLRLADADPRFEYNLIGATMRLHLDDGTVIWQRIRRRTGLSPRGVRPGDLEWPLETLLTRHDVNEELADGEVAGVRIEVARLSLVELQSLSEHGGRLEFAGRVDALVLEDWGSLPLTPGAELNRETSRFRIQSIRPPGGSGPLLRFLSETTRSYLDIPEGGFTGYSNFALVNRELGVGFVVPVQTRGQRHAMVFAGGATATAFSHELDVPLIFSERGQVPAVDETWLRGAELMVMPAVSVGGYPIVAELEDVRIVLDESRMR